MEHAAATATLALLEGTDAGFWNENVTVRIVHKWESRNFKKGMTLKGHELLFLDCEYGGVDKITPAAFKKHLGREMARKWEINVWVITGGEKVPLSKTILLKFYNEASEKYNRSTRLQGTKVNHRDEFVGCNECYEVRRGGSGQGAKTNVVCITKQ